MSSKPQKPTQPQANTTVNKPLGLPREVPDDRYPGSFFRIPGVVVPGKTTWSIAK